MAYSATAIANAFLDIARRAGCNDLTPMKLQKLVYFAHGWYLAASGNPLINETVEAWRYGPVVPSIYNQAKIYGNSPISEHLGNYRLNEHGKIQLIPELLTDEELADLGPVLNWIWKQYGSLSGITLSNITHLPGTPWSEAIEEMRQNGGFQRNYDITPDKIKNYFTSEMQKLTPIA